MSTITRSMTSRISRKRGTSKSLSSSWLIPSRKNCRPRRSSSSSGSATTRQRSSTSTWTRSMRLWTTTMRGSTRWFMKRTMIIWRICRPRGRGATIRRMQRAATSLVISSFRLRITYGCRRRTYPRMRKEHQSVVIGLTYWGRASQVFWILPVLVSRNTSTKGKSSNLLMNLINFFHSFPDLVP